MLIYDFVQAFLHTSAAEVTSPRILVPEERVEVRDYVKWCMVLAMYRHVREPCLDGHTAPTLRHIFPTHEC